MRAGSPPGAAVAAAESAVDAVAAIAAAVAAQAANAADANASPTSVAAAAVAAAVAPEATAAAVAAAVAAQGAAAKEKAAVAAVATAAGARTRAQVGADAFAPPRARGAPAASCRCCSCRGRPACGSPPRPPRSAFAAARRLTRRSQVVGDGRRPRLLTWCCTARGEPSAKVAVAVAASAASALHVAAFARQSG